MLARKNVKERLATQLIILREKFNGDAESTHPTEISISRDDLANLVGTARENVVRIMSGFKADGIVYTKGRKITILDEQRLIEIATG
jgi:CRP-like cAMP-binding protein